MTKSAAKHKKTRCGGFLWMCRVILLKLDDGGRLPYSYLEEPAVGMQAFT